MAPPTTGPTSSATPHKPAFGSILIASRPARDRSRVATGLISAILHGGVVGGLVYSTIDGGPETIWDPAEVIEITRPFEAPPPPPPPPVEAAAPTFRGPPPSITPPDVIPPEIPPPGR